MRSRNLVAGLVAAVLISAAAPAARQLTIQDKLSTLKKLPPKFSFAVLGDNRGGDAVYRKIIGLALERKPAFVVNTGDVITEPGSREQWADFWASSKRVTVPYFLTVGNHDVSAAAAGSEATYRDEVDLPGNELSYSFEAGNSLFIVLDTCIKGEERRITGRQIAWLEGVLADAKQKHIFVFLHHPVFSGTGAGRHGGNNLDRYPADRDRLHALFREHRVTTVFSGHEHLYLRRIVDGVPYIITGGGGAPLYAKDANGGFHHFILVTVDGDAVIGEAVDVDGRVRDRFDLGERP